MNLRHEGSPTNDRKRSQNTKCSICWKKFKSNHLLAQHAKTHDNRKIQCKICHKWMKNRNILRAHEIMHDELPQKCPQCDKIKLNERALKSHILQCHSVLRHQCTICRKSFARPNKLKVCFILTIQIWS